MSPHNDTSSCRLREWYQKLALLLPKSTILVIKCNRNQCPDPITAASRGEIMMIESRYVLPNIQKKGRTYHWVFFSCVCVCVYVHVDVNIWGGGKVIVSSWYDGARWNIWKDFVGWLGRVMAQRKYKCLKMFQSITGCNRSAWLKWWVWIMLMYVSYPWSLILYSPSFSSKAKKRGSNTNPLSSRCRVSARCRSSTASFASVARSISFCLIPSVTLDHNL